MLFPIHTDILTPKVDDPDIAVPLEFGVKIQKISFLGGIPLFTPRNTVFLFHKKLVLIKTHRQNPKHGDQN